MSDFKPINTQEEFNEAIRERLARESKKYEGYSSPDEVAKIKNEYEEKIKGLGAEHAKKISEKDGAIAERDGKIKKYETDSAKAKIAHELGLPYEAAAYIRGESEEDIKKSAEGLKSILGEKKPDYPLLDLEKGGGGEESAERAGLKRMLSDLKGED